VQSTACFGIPDTDVRVERAIANEADLEAVVAEARSYSSQNGHPMIEIGRPDGASLLIGIYNDSACLGWMGTDDLSYWYVSQDLPGVNVVSYFGHHTEVPRRRFGPIDTIQDIAMAFIQGMSRDAIGVELEAD
jgi:hypothetical protein